MQGAKRIARWLGLGLAAILAIATLALGLLYGLAQSEAGRDWMARRLEALLSAPGEHAISIGRLDGGLPQSIGLTDLSIGDARGPWLTAGSVRLDWRPLDLLSGTLRVRALEVGALQLDRLPETAESAPAPSGLPTLPVELTVERFEAAEITLGPEVLGVAAAFGVEGRAASDSSGALSAVLQAARSDGVAGQIDAEARYVPADDHLTLALAVSEPPGGLIARALDIAGLPAVEARLKGAGPLAAWDGRLEIALAGLGRLEAQLKLAGETQPAFGIAGSMTSERPFDGLPWRLLSGHSTFEVQGHWRDPAVLAVENARLDSPAGSFELVGSLDTRSLALEADAKAALQDRSVLAELLPDVEIRGLTLTARASGPALAPALRIKAEAAALKASGIAADQVAAELSFTPDGPAEGASWAGRLTTAGRAARVTPEDAPAWQPVLGRQLEWQAEGRFDPARAEVTAETFTIDTGALRATGRGSYGFDSGEASAALAVAYPDLSLLAARLGTGIEGRVQLDAALTAAVFGGGLKVELSGELRDLALAEPLVDALLAGGSRFKAALSLEPDGRLAVSDLAVVSTAARISGAAAFSAGFDRLEADYRVEVADLAVLGPAAGQPLAGAAVVLGRALGAPANPGLSGELTIAGAAAGDLALGELRLGYTAEDLPGRARGRLEGELEAPFGRLRAETRYRLDGPLLRLDGLALTGGQMHASGRAEIPLDGRPVTAELAAEAESLTPWLALAGLAAEGQGRLRLELSPAGPRQAAALDAELGGLTVPLDGGDSLRIAGLTAKLTSDDLHEQQRGSLALTARNLALGALALDRLEANGASGPAGGSLDLSAAGQWFGPLEVAASGTVSITPETLSLELARLQGRALDQNLRLRRPARLTRGARSWDLADLDLALGGARLEAAARLDAERISAALTLEALPIAALAPFWPTQGTSGLLNGKLSLDGTTKEPEGRMTLSAAQIETDAVPDAPPLALSLDGDWRGGRVRVTGRVTGLSAQDATLEAELPLRLAPDSFAPVVPTSEALTAKLGWRGPVEPLWALVPVSGQDLEGAGRLQIDVAGTPALPRVTGQLSLRNGRYENLMTGTLLRDLVLQVDLDGERATIVKAAAGDGGSGSLSASGSLALLPERGFPMTITTELKAFTLLRRDDVTAASDGKVLFEGSLQAAVLKGQLQSKGVEIRIPERLPPEVVELAVVEIEQNQGPPGLLAPSAPLAEVTSPIALTLDLGVEMPRQVFLRGRGLDSEWSGSLNISGSAAHPVIRGKLNLVRGQVSALGKVFDLQRGTVDFVAGERIDPVMDITATRQEADIAVTVHVSGPTSRPHIKLSSVPTLPEDEIVSRTLFGKSTARLSAFEAVQLAAAVAELSGRGGTTGGILDKVRTALGVDVLRIETNGTQDSASPAVSAGKYLTKDVYVGVKQGTTATSGAVEAEVELTPNISIETEVGETGNSNVGIKFKWDY